MMKKTNLTLSLVALLILLVAGAAYYWHRSSSALPAASTNTSTVVGKPTVLLGTIQAIQGDILTLALRQGGNAKITVSSTTVITTNVPKDAKTLAAGFTEYQALKAKAGEKPFTPPSPSVTKTLSQSDLKVGLMILVTPQVYSTTEATAASVLVLLAPASSTPAI